MLNTTSYSIFRTASRAQFFAGSPVLQTLVDQSTPVIRISGLKTDCWRGLKAEGDSRNGPWFYSLHEILDAQSFQRRGECLYFLLDGKGQLRYVGESKNNLRDRWRTPPGMDVQTGELFDGRTVFHNRAWRHLEHALLMDPAAGPFTVSVLTRAQVEATVERLPELQAWVRSLQSAKPEKHLAQSVQDWIVRQTDLQEHLWNVTGTSKRGARAYAG